MTEDETRVGIRVCESIGRLLADDGREYQLRDGDRLRLPETTAGPLLDSGAVERTDEDACDNVELSGSPEPVVSPADGVRVITASENGDVRGVELGTWVCQRCNSITETGVANGDVEEPHECSGCDRQGPFDHVGGLTAEDLEMATRAGDMWQTPTGIDDTGYRELWGDVRQYLYGHWDAGDGDQADAVYAGLTAYALSTWVRENLTFLPHLMLMGKTTGGKTRLLNTLARVSYRAIVSASATPASMYRLIHAYDVSFYISEYHGLHPDTRRELDAVVRAGQKENEKVTRAEPTTTGHEPKTFDPFTHVAIATQYEPDDDIVNRCIQIRSSTANREMPATLDETGAEVLRDRLLYARYRLLHSDEWADAEADAYEFLADRNIAGRTREKLLGLLTVAHVWDRVDEIEPFVETVVQQDRKAAADSEDALVVEAIRDLAFDEIVDARASTFGSGDPFGTVEIPYSDIADHYESMTGIEKSNSWIGHVRKRLGFEKERKRNQTVISDPDLGPKLRGLCDELNLDWDRNKSGTDDDVSQSEAVQTVQQVVDQLADDSSDGFASRDDVINALDGRLGDRNPEHLVAKALESGEFYEPQEGRIAPT